MKGLRKKIILSLPFILVLVVGWWFWGANIQLLTSGSFSAPKKSIYGLSAVSVALGDILIFKTPESQYGAIRFDRMTDDWGANYSSWFKHSGMGKTLNVWKEFKGHVFQKYWRTRIDASSHKVKDIGGEYWIRCGDISLSWSAPTWVYFPKGYSVAVVQAKNISNVDIFDETISWKMSPFGK